MEKLLHTILEEIQTTNHRLTGIEHEIKEIKVDVSRLFERVDSLDKRVDSLDKRVESLDKHVESLDMRAASLDKRVTSIGTELKEFREETNTSLVILHTGQQGFREELTQRFKETYKKLDIISGDIEFTYQKTALHDLQIRRIENS